MTTRVRILSNGFATPNSRAIEYPVVRNLGLLRERGLKVSIVHELGPDLGDCDTVILDGRFFKSWWNEAPERVFELVDRLRGQGARVLYFDTSDSSGWLKAELLPAVDRYYKNQMLADRGRFLSPLYGARLFADYYHRQFGVEDSEPLVQKPIEDAALLDKLRVSWNSGLADYSFAGLYLAEAYKRLGWRALLRAPMGFAPATGPRPLGATCRITTRYARESVAWQRIQVREKLAGHVATDRLSRRLYFREMARSKIVVSPFGWGEVNYKDFEAFISGALLLKPDMTHMTTWPNFYSAGETIVAHGWDLEDLEARVEEILADYPRFVGIAAEGQERYRRAAASREGREAFCERFQAIAEDRLPWDGVDAPRAAAAAPVQERERQVDG